jgi:hypothetical protein
MDPATAAVIVSTLRRDGHCVREDPDMLLAHCSPLEGCHLLITTLNRHGAEASNSLDELRERIPALPLLLVAEAIEAGAAGARLPDGFTVLHLPVNIDELRMAVRRLLPLLGGGTVLAGRVAESAIVTHAPTGAE